MNFRSATKFDHPSGGMLALFAGKISPGTAGCGSIAISPNAPYGEAQVKAIRASSQELRREAESETLTSFEAIADWSQLEREMVGNIAVGVAAARCIDHVHKSRRMLIPSAFAAALLVIFALGWTTHIPNEQTQHILTSIRSWWGGEAPLTSGTVLRSSPGGIAVRSQGTTLTMLNPRSAMVSLSGGSSVEARFIDETTGQVTITSVYGQ